VEVIVDFIDENKAELGVEPVCKELQDFAPVLAAVFMRLQFSLQRAHSDGLVASSVDHVLWSTLRLLALPK
jgi:hypothetical protein